jgi:probable phosphoglycerate mutase
MELYIVRHGQTAWNALGRLQGTADIDLNEKGRRDAIALGEDLDARQISFDAIYVSPLIRAYETACLIRGRKTTPIIRDERLRELNFGEGEGTDSREWLREDSPYRCFFDAPDKYIPPKGGETLEALCLRTKDFLTKELEPRQDEFRRVMIVAHGALNKGLMSYLEHNTLEHFWGQGLQKNCDADIFTFDGQIWTK